MSDWKAVLQGSRRDAAIAAACEVAARVADPRRVAMACSAAPAQTTYPRTVRWEPHSIAQGDAGLALMCAQFDRCFPNTGWDVTAHRFLTDAARSAEDVQLRPGLFSGLSGLGFVTLVLARDGSRYQKLSTAIETEVVPQTLGLAQTVRHRDGGLTVSEFDTISGLAGIGAYLLAYRSRPPLANALKRSLEALGELVSGRADDVPRWFTPAELHADPATAARYPGGSLNCGLAHGIPGPLALMALALSAGADVAGLAEAVGDVAAWIVAHRRDDVWGVNWPAMVRLPERGRPADAPSRAAWCYGTPGVARALWLAGRALSDDSLQKLSTEAMEAVYRRPVPAREIDSPTFCHGMAGLLQVTLRFWHDTGLPVYARAAADLTDQLLDAYEPDVAVLGFRCIENGGNRVDQAGLLDGAPGTALTLLAASTTVEPTWDRLFLLA